MTETAKHYWYARDCNKFQTKTAHLSLVEMGAYDRLLDWYYLNRRPIPDDAVQMHRICRAVAPDEQAAVQVVVRQFFTLEADGWHNRTADEEIAKAQGISQKRRNAQAEKERKRIASAGANAPSNAPTETVTETRKVEPKGSTYGTASPAVIEMAFQQVWGAYPGRGKNGDTGAAYKGERKAALIRFTTIMRNTKETDRAELVRTILAGVERYAAFIERADYPSKHLSTWLNAEGWRTDYRTDTAGHGKAGAGPAARDHRSEAAKTLDIADDIKRRRLEAAGGGAQGQPAGAEPADRSAGANLRLAQEVRGEGGPDRAARHGVSVAAVGLSDLDNRSGVSQVPDDGA